MSNNKEEKLNELNAILEVANQYFSQVNERSDLLMFVSWVEARKSLIIKDEKTCPLCNLEPHKQMGGISCKYCGMMGLMPWGG